MRALAQLHNRCVELLCAEDQAFRIMITDLWVLQQMLQKNITLRQIYVSYFSKIMDSSLEVVGFIVDFFATPRSHFGGGITNVFEHIWRFEMLCKHKQGWSLVYCFTTGVGVGPNATKQMYWTIQYVHWRQMTYSL